MADERFLDVSSEPPPEPNWATPFVCGPLTPEEMAWLRYSKKQVYIVAEKMRQERLAAEKSQEPTSTLGG